MLEKEEVSSGDGGFEADGGVALRPYARCFLRGAYLYSHSGCAQVMQCNHVRIS